MGDTGGIEVAFKFLLHEQYSRDLSQKIKSAKREKARRGESITKNCVFGYKKVGKQLEIDEPAAETVRLIFDLARSGMSLANIAAWLYADKRPTPTEYKKHARRLLAEGFSCLWHKSAILELLSDERYVGTYVAGKTKTVEVGSGKQIKIAESEWIRIPDHHPAIVDKAVFQAAREKIDRKGEPLRKREIGTSHRYRHIGSPLIRRVSCGCCGHRLRLSSTHNAAFHCEFTRAAPDAPCHRLKILANDLESVVFERIRGQAQAIVDAKDSSPIVSENQTDRKSQITKMEDAKRALYERFIIGEISADEYKSEKTGLDAETDRLKRAYAKSAEKSAKVAAGTRLQQIAVDALSTAKLTQPIADALIEKVLVYPGNRVEVVWKIAGLNSNEMEGLVHAPKG